MPVIDYQTPSISPSGQPGSSLALASAICALFSAASGAIGAACGYHSSFLGPAQMAFYLLTLLSCVVGFVGFSLGALALARSKGRRGWIGLLLSLAITIAVIFVSRAVPTYGMGNIKG
jgi:hypothetical protein